MSASGRTRCPGRPTPRFDPQLLEHGDRRNVLDRYRYWTVAAIVADLDTRRHEFAVAIENWQHDMNIGTVVRTANAFLAAEVIIVGRRRWNRRGAMVTDRYQHIRHVDSPAELASYAADGRLHDRGDRQPARRGADRIDHLAAAIAAAVRPGIGRADRQAARAVASMVCSIAQYGSTRSINAGVAAGIAMHAWIRQHALLAIAVAPTVRDWTEVSCLAGAGSGRSAAR